MSDCTTCDSMTMVAMLRAIIGDWDAGDYEYTDSKLKQLLATAAKISLAESYTGSTSYTVTTSNVAAGEFSISPDPSDLICSLVVTKAACLLVNAELRSMANLEGLKMVCDKASMSKVEGGKSWEILMSEGPCAAYKNLKYTLETAPMKSGEFYKAILTPFINDRFRDSGWCDNELS